MQDSMSFGWPKLSLTSVKLAGAYLALSLGLGAIATRSRY